MSKAIRLFISQEINVSQCGSAWFEVHRRVKHESTTHRDTPLVHREEIVMTSLITVICAVLKRLLSIELLFLESIRDHASTPYPSQHVKDDISREDNVLYHMRRPNLRARSGILSHTISKNESNMAEC